MLNKKSQMEIMGLAIVIILIIIGMLFVIRFVMVRKPAEFKEEFTKTQLASNMLNTFLKTNTNCYGMSITELLQDCGQSTSVSCDGETSCEYVENAAKEIFSKTLEEWNLKYYFSVYFEDEEETPKIKVSEKCVGNRETKIFPIPTTPRNLYTRLDICG